MSFADRYSTLIESLAQREDGPVADWRLLHLPGDRPPWVESGLNVAEGDQVTWLAAGKVVLSQELGLWGALERNSDRQAAFRICTCTPRSERRRMSRLASLVRSRESK